MTAEERLSAFMNLILNSSIVFDGVATEAIGKARGDAGGAKKALKELLSVSKGEIELVVGKMTPVQRKNLLEDLGDASYDRVFEAIRQQDFKLPRLTERLSVEELLAYVELARKKDPRLAKVEEQVKKMKAPRIFSAAGDPAPPAESMEAPKAAATKVAKVPKTIGKLPGTYLFPPGAETTLSLKGTGELKLKWESILEPGKFCDDFGIEVRQGTSAVKSPYGGMTLNSVNGKITATIKNLEAFPMAVEISAER
jgi:hypothetical protein